MQGGTTHNRWAGLACALVCALFIVLAGAGCASQNSAASSSGASGVESAGSEAAASADADADADAAADADAGEATADSTEGEAADSGQQADAATSEQTGTDAEPQPEAEAPATAEPADLAWRDSDFALDPARTDWNYDSNGRKTVYLTIDDGPSELTPQVLDILDRYGCKATFFVVGHDPDSYHYIKEAYDRGHTIGLHTYTHDYAQVYASTDAYFADLDAIGEVVRDQIGYVPCFIRFPGGSSNAVSADYSKGIMSKLVDEVQALGYQYYDWNTSSGDGSEHTADEIAGYATEPNEYENIVLLCHDSATKQSTIDALPRIIEHYQGLGYTFEAIDRSTVVTHHGVNN